jgi:hypothetical protein
VYRIRIVSEEIARAYARPGHEVIAYNAPIVTRDEHVAVVERAQETINTLRQRIDQLQRALPAGASAEDTPGHIIETWEDEPAEGPDDDDEEDEDLP